MHVYHGDLHNHTSYSDGSLTPYDAFTRAVAAGLDFLAVTDHSYAIDDAEWADTLTQANAFTRDGAFVALRGFEYTQGAEGHINVYNSVRHAVRTNTGLRLLRLHPQPGGRASPWRASTAGWRSPAPRRWTTRAW